jgi:hypothetical protein
MEITPEIVSFIKDVSLGVASGRLQEQAQNILASIEAAQQPFAADLATCVCELSNLQNGACTKCGLPWFPPSR